MRRSLFALLAVAALAGCATMIDTPFQQISFDTPGVRNADCRIHTPNGRYRVITPQVTQIDRSPDTLEIHCHKAGYYDAYITVKSRFTGHTLLNVFNGLLPGGALDVASNSDYTYPHLINIPMQVDPDGTSKLEEEEAATPPERKPVEEKPVKEAKPDTAASDKTVNHSLRK